MKRTVLFALVAVAFVAGTTSMSLAKVATGAGISAPGSAHNFTDNIRDSKTDNFINENGVDGWNAGRSEICRVCHAPHDHGRDYANNGPLWNHSLSQETYIPYASATFDATFEDAGKQPTGSSKLCLACHDGSVALDTFDKYAGTTGKDLVGAGYSAGFKIPKMSTANDLTGTHPISIKYDDALITKDGSLLDPTATIFKNGTSAFNIDKYLEGGTVLQCSTCHDVHDSPSAVVVGTHLLRAPMKGDSGNVNGNASALCLSCHQK